MAHSDLVSLPPCGICDAFQALILAVDTCRRGLPRHDCHATARRHAPGRLPDGRLQQDHFVDPFLGAVRLSWTFEPDGRLGRGPGGDRGSDVADRACRRTLYRRRRSPDDRGRCPVVLGLAPPPMAARWRPTRHLIRRFRVTRGRRNSSRCSIANHGYACHEGRDRPRGRRSRGIPRDGAPPAGA